MVKSHCRSWVTVPFKGRIFQTNPKIISNTVITPEYQQFTLCTCQCVPSWPANQIELPVMQEWQFAQRFSTKLMDITQTKKKRKSETLKSNYLEYTWHVLILMMVVSDPLRICTNHHLSACQFPEKKEELVSTFTGSFTSYVQECTQYLDAWQFQ